MSIKIKKPKLNTALSGTALCSTAVMMLCSLNAVADEKRTYRGDIELGAAITTGNSETASAKTAVNVEQDFTDWRTEYMIDAQYQRSQFKNDQGESERETTEQQIFVSYQGNYKLAKETETFFVYGAYNDERFNGYNYQLTTAVGYGWRFYETGNNTIDLEIGPGLSLNELDDGTKRQGGIFRGAFTYEQELTVATKFRQELVTDLSFSGENSITKAESSMIAQINGQLAMRFSFLLEYNTKPQEERRKIDTETGITLVYSF
ncbi:MAG: putative salt-induced outer membrane protein [Alteromonadaceae bacterium]|jgi:putative salt-induced outer membrane protein